MKGGVKADAPVQRRIMKNNDDIQGSSEDQEISESAVKFDHYNIGPFFTTVGSMADQSQTRQEQPQDRMRRRSHLPRDAQGCVRLQWLENFFETLYASNEKVNIPYTVVFQYRRIYAAYFTDSEGYVQKIDKIADLSPEQVIEGLKTTNAKDSKRRSSKSPMARAYYIYQKRSDDLAQASDGDLSVEYFDDQSLAYFLTYRSKEDNGIVQQFMEPTTVNVSAIRAYWTPHFCQLETRMNVNRADDAHVPMQRRAVTFEGEHHHSQPFPLSSKLAELPQPCKVRTWFQ